MISVYTKLCLMHFKDSGFDPFKQIIYSKWVHLAAFLPNFRGTHLKEWVAVLKLL